MSGEEKPLRVADDFSFGERFADEISRDADQYDDLFTDDLTDPEGN